MYAEVFMKNNLAVLVFFFSILPSSLCFSQLRNPQVRGCQLTAGGTIVDITFTKINEDHESVTEEIALCKLGQSYIGALDVALAIHKSDDYQTPLSFTEVMSTDNNCSGQVMRGLVLGTQIFLDLCIYDDHSSVDLKTLKNGPSSELNKFISHYNP
jgi:hypothetical protein